MRRWLYHLVPRGTPVPEAHAPPSLEREGFIHASYKDAVAESARLYFPAHEVDVWRVDPRRVAGLREDATPRGPMPHVAAPIPRDAVREVLRLDGLAAAPDAVRGTVFAFAAFEGMTLLDLVGPFDALSRIASMGFDPSSRCAIVAATERAVVWTGAEATVAVSRVRPPLDDVDVLVVPGGPGTRALVGDAQLLDWLRSFPPNRVVASVCTGALLLGAAGRLRGVRATTHARMIDDLPRYGATPVRGCRVVDEGAIVTAGGVTCGLDLGVHLIHRFYGAEVAEAVAAQMELAGT